MDDLNSFKEKLEANLLILNKFEGLEDDLIQQHGNLRAQFSEYREAIESANLSEKDKREHYGCHDELVKKLHKLILEAKALARKRTEQMTRDELFKMSQERQKALKPQSAEDKIGDEVTKSLKRMLETMRVEVERSSANISTARETTKNLQGTTDNYEKLSGTLEESRGLIRDLWKKNRNDMIYILGALGVFIATAVWVIVQRTPGTGIVWLPGKLVLRQLGNLIPKSSEKAGKFVEKVVEMTEAVLSDSEEAPEMFVDQILNKQEYGNDNLLKENQEENHVYDLHEIVQRSEPKPIANLFSKVSEQKNNEHVEIDNEPANAVETTNNVADNVNQSETTETGEIIQTQEIKVENDAAEIHEPLGNPVKVAKEEPVIPTEKVVENRGNDINGEESTVKVEENVPIGDNVQKSAANVEKVLESNSVYSATEVHTESSSVTNEAPTVTVEATGSETPTATSSEAHITIETPTTTVQVPIITEVPSVTVEEPIIVETPTITVKADVITETPIAITETPIVITETTTSDPSTSKPHVSEQVTEAFNTETSSFATNSPPEIVKTQATVTKIIPEIKEVPVTITPLANAKIMTQSVYYTATESDSEGNQSIYSSETEIFSGNEEKVDL